MTARHAAATFPEPTAAKVPAISAMFWTIKILTTAAGEAASDYLALHNKVVGAGVELAIFVVALVLQLRVRRYDAIRYWFLALAIAIAGTGVSDTLHLTVGLPYSVTTVGWFVVLGVVFWLWHRSEGTLSIHSVLTRRRELFYWATVFATFALGTAWGDLTASTFGWGYLSSGLIFGAMILVPLAGWRLGRWNPIFSFWFAYVLTRPLGASFADYVSKPRAVSGAGFGDGQTAIVAIVIIAVLVVYVAITGRDVQSPEDALR